VTSKVPLSVRALRTFNPVVVVLLRSPLHRLMSRDLLVVEYAGRKSGKRYRKPLAYIGEGGALYLFARKKMSDWWRNFTDGATVRVLHGGKWHDAKVRVLPPSKPEALVRFREFLTRNPRTAPIVYDVGLSPDKRPLEADLTARIGETAIVRLDLPGPA
jgi:deazaflavin-dependent oxidoreductase (nitroreductase family)